MQTIGVELGFTLCGPQAFLLIPNPLWMSHWLDWLPNITTISLLTTMLMIRHRLVAFFALILIMYDDELDSTYMFMNGDVK